MRVFLALDPSSSLLMTNQATGYWIAVASSSRGLSRLLPPYCSLHWADIESKIMAGRRCRREGAQGEQSMVRRRCRGLHGTGTRRLQMLLEKGPDVESKDRLGGQTPLSWAALLQRRDMRRL
jgi:hypothetical protein